MKPLVTLPVLAAATALLLGPCARAAGPCPPDGDDTGWPTFEPAEKCGDYSDCDALMQTGQLAAAHTCNQKIDDCAADLIKSNAKADAHNLALEACRASIWSTKVSKPADE
ncbi:MAG: hypothetical protein ACM3MH_06315 [Actinomycetota bacterium]